MSKKKVTVIKTERDQGMDNARTRHAKEFAEMELGSAQAKLAAETVKIETETAIMQQEHDAKERRSRKEDILKILGLIVSALGAAGGIGSTIVSCTSASRIRREEMDHISREHDKAYEFERYGAEHMVTSQNGRRIVGDDIKLK